MFSTGAGHVQSRFCERQSCPSARRPRGGALPRERRGSRRVVDHISKAGGTEARRSDSQLLHVHSRCLVRDGRLPESRAALRAHVIRPIHEGAAAGAARREREGRRARHRIPGKHRLHARRGRTGRRCAVGQAVVRDGACRDVRERETGIRGCGDAAVAVEKNLLEQPATRRVKGYAGAGVPHAVSADRNIRHVVSCRLNEDGRRRGR